MATGTAPGGSAKVWLYLTQTGERVPCLVVQGYTAYTSRTVNTPSVTEANLLFADILILGNAQTKLFGVAVDTTAGTVVGKISLGN